MARPLAGEKVKASHITPVLYIKKTATESVVSSTTLQNDDDFVVSLEANKTYRVEVVLSSGGSGTADIKIDWVVTGGVAQLVSRACVGAAASNVDGTDTNMRATRNNLTTAVVYGIETGSSGAIREDFLVETTTAGTSGTLTMRWAQNVSNATATTLSTSSYLILTEIEAA